MTTTVRRLARAEWERWCTSAVDLPVTCHPGWADALARVPSWEAAAIPFHVESPDGEALAVGYPRRRKGIDDLTMSPLGLNAAFHSRSEAGRSSLLAGFIRAQQMRWRSVALVQPFYLPATEPGEDAPDVFDGGTTHILELSSSYDTLFERRFKGATRTCIRRAESVGVRVERALGPEAVSGYYRMHRELADSMGGYAEVYPEAVFHALLNNCDRAELLIATLDNRTVGGAIFLDDGPTTFYWHAAADRTYARAQPAYAILSRAISDAIERGKGWFNFGSSGGIQSLVRFKESWGTEPAPIVSEVYRNPVIRRLRSLRENAIGLVSK